MKLYVNGSPKLENGNSNYFLNKIKDKEIQKKLKNFTKGKSTVWISLKEDFPEALLIELIEKYKEEG